MAFLDVFFNYSSTGLIYLPYSEWYIFNNEASFILMYDIRIY